MIDRDFNHEHEKDSKWEGLVSIIKELKERGAKGFLRDVHDINDAFREKKHEHACCMDEGTAFIPLENGKLCMAGSGILYPADSEEERLINVARIYLEKGVKEVTSHEGCGAAKLAYSRDHSEADLHAISPRTVDNYAQEWVTKLAAKMRDIQRQNQTEPSVAHKHINVAEMARPKEFHNAVAAYYDGTGIFNPAGITGLPMGFVINRNIDGKEYALTELGVSIDIAFGSHGFGNRFTDDLPFTIIVIGTDSQALELHKEVEVALLKNEHREKIKIGTFVAE